MGDCTCFESRRAKALRVRLPLSPLKEVIYMQEFKNFEGVNFPLIRNTSSLDYEELVASADPQDGLNLLIDTMIEVVKELGNATKIGES